MPVSKKEQSACPVDAAMAVLDGRWKGTILCRLSKGPLRPSELRRSIPGITERMLIRQLQEMVQDGIIYRKEKNLPSPWVQYQISRYGELLYPIVQSMAVWGKAHALRTPAQIEAFNSGTGALKSTD